MSFPKITIRPAPKMSPEEMRAAVARLKAEKKDLALELEYFKELEEVAKMRQEVAEFRKPKPAAPKPKPEREPESKPAAASSSSSSSSSSAFGVEIVSEQRRENRVFVQLNSLALREDTIGVMAKFLHAQLRKPGVQVARLGFRSSSDYDLPLDGGKIYPRQSLEEIAAGLEALLATFYEMYGDRDVVWTLNDVTLFQPLAGAGN